MLLWLLLKFFIHMLSLFINPSLMKAFKFMNFTLYEFVAASHKF